MNTSTNSRSMAAVSWSSLMPVATDLAGMLQPIERQLPRELILGPIDRGHQRRIKAQHVVVDQVLVASPRPAFSQSVF